MTTSARVLALNTRLPVPGLVRVSAPVLGGMRAFSVLLNNVSLAIWLTGPIRLLAGRRDRGYGTGVALGHFLFNCKVTNIQPDPQRSTENIWKPKKSTRASFTKVKIETWRHETEQIAGQ